MLKAVRDIVFLAGGIYIAKKAYQVVKLFADGMDEMDRDILENSSRINNLTDKFDELEMHLKDPKFIKWRKENDYV